MVVTSDGRLITGTLIGLDQVQNLILNNSQEYVYNGTSTTNDKDESTTEQVPLGLYVIRGDTVCLVGEHEESSGSVLEQTADPLPSVQQVLF